jgi:transposase
MTNPTRWVGIDLHRRRSQIAVIDEHGELELSRRIVNDRDTFRELLGDPAGAHVALEATYGWEWLAELLDEAGYDVHLAHPLRTRRDRRRAREDRRCGRQDARASAAHRAAA